LEAKDFDRFLHLVIESGYSSWMLNQNISLSKDFEHQELAVALAVSEKILKGQGAWRVHGGGFAGTIQAFVPDTLLEKYSSELNKIFGPGSCHELIIRPEGAIHIQFV
jgi:galactokinase